MLGRADFELSVCEKASTECIYQSNVLEGVDLDLKSYCLLTAASPMSWNIDELPLTDVAFQLKALNLFSLTTTMQSIKATLRDVLLDNAHGSLNGVDVSGKQFLENFDICLDGTFPAIEKRATFYVRAHLKTRRPAYTHLLCFRLQEVRKPIQLGPCKNCCVFFDRTLMRGNM
jgi:hypothetical protein